MRDVLQNRFEIETFATNLKWAAIIGFLLVLPIAAVDFWFNRTVLEPFALFAVVWILPVAFIVVLAPIVQSVRTGNNLLSNPVSLILRFVFLAAVAVVWSWGLADQMPCFLGIPNCD